MEEYGRAAREIDNDGVDKHRCVFEHRANCETWDSQDRKAWRKSGYTDGFGVKRHVLDTSLRRARRWGLAGNAADYIWSHRGEDYGQFRRPMGLNAFRIPYNYYCPTEYISAEVPNWPGLDLPHYMAPDAIRLVLSISTACYAGLHASAWNGHFTSKLERNIWLCCCLYIAISGFAVIFWYAVKSLAHSLHMYRFRGWWTHMFDNLQVVLIGLLVVYFLARGFLVVEAFISLRKVPETVYETPVWTHLIPHL